MSIEIWKPIKVTNGKYEISNLGRVKSFQRKPIIMSPTTGSNGYRKVTLFYNKKAHYFNVSCLVLTEFIGERPKGYQVCHNNGDRVDDRLGNLRWDTVKANNEDKKRHGTCLIGSKNPWSLLKEHDVLRIIEITDRKLKSQRSICKSFGVSQTTITDIVRGKSWGWLTGRSYESLKHRKAK